VVLDKISLDQRNKATLVATDLHHNLEQETVVVAVVPVLLDKIAIQQLLLHQELVEQVFKF
jgi:hypothetical protein